MSHLHAGAVRRRIPALLLIAVLTAGCHVYEPVSEPPAPGTEVRVRLTAPGALEMSRESDEPRRHYEGQLVENDPDTLILSVVQARNVSEFQRSRTLRNNFLIPRDYVQRLEVRALSGWRTAGVVAAGAGVAAFLINRAVEGGGSSGNGPDGGPGPVNIRIPLGYPPP